MDPNPNPINNVINKQTLAQHTLHKYSTKSHNIIKQIMHRNMNQRPCKEEPKSPKKHIKNKTHYKNNHMVFYC